MIARYRGADRWFYVHPFCGVFGEEVTRLREEQTCQVCGHPLLVWTVTDGDRIAGLPEAIRMRCVELTAETRGETLICADCGRLVGVLFNGACADCIGRNP